MADGYVSSLGPEASEFGAVTNTQLFNILREMGEDKKGGLADPDYQSIAEGDSAFAVRHAFGDRSVPERVEQLLREKGWPVRHLATDRFTLEDVFVALIREHGPLRDLDEEATETAAAAQSQGGAA